MAARNWSASDEIVYEATAAGVRLALAGQGIVSGGVPSEKAPPGMFVTLTGGSAVIGGAVVSWAGQDIAITTAPTTATHVRQDLIYITAAGPAITAGVAGAAPSDASYPDPVALPSASVPLALVEVGNSVTTIVDARIVDIRSITHGALGAVVGTTNTQTLTNKTLTAPTIADFTNAQHDHGDADDGGSLSLSLGGTPALTLGTTNTAGVATTYIRTDDTILAFDATVPSTQASGDAAAAGSAAVAARRDHKHAMPTEATVSASGFESAADKRLLAYFSAGNSGASLTIDWNNGASQHVTMTGNCTFTFSNPAQPGWYALRLAQDATGSRTATWPATVKWSGATAPTLTTTASRVDLLTFYWDGAAYLGASVLNFTV